MLKVKTVIKALIGPISITYYLIIAFFLGLLIAWIYKKSNKSVSYSQSFVNMLALLLPTVTLIIMFIANNIARAVGVFGAFSVVRFRTAIKDAKDMFFIFWVLAIGLVLGVGQVLSAIFATTLIALMIYFLYKTNFGRFSDYDYLLVYLLDTKKSDTSEVTQALTPLVKHQELLNIQSSKEGTEVEITLSLSLRPKVSIESIIRELKRIKGIKSLSVNPAQFELEY